MRSQASRTLGYAMDYILTVSEQTDSQAARDILKQAIDKLEAADRVITSEQ